MLPFAFFAALCCLFLWRVFIPGEAFVPAELLRYAAPWSAGHPRQQAWNPLMYDSVGAFLPWRLFTARSLSAGVIPLWNPYQFCGTPFVANVQSAVFYPSTLLIVWLGPVTAAGVLVLLQMMLAGGFTVLLMRRLGAGPAGAAIAAVAFTFSTWEVSWLHLPTFLQTTCWLPLALLLTLRLFDAPRFARAAGLAVVVGLVLSAGHLQLALYAMLAVGALAAVMVVRLRSARGVVLFAAACVIGAALSAPMLLPAVELSRMSHRAGKPTAIGYAAYTGYAVNADALVTAFVPDFYGNPSSPDSPYFGTSRGGMYFNYAEGALFVGLLPLLLAAVALIRGGAQRAARLWLAALAVVALLMALGTPVDALLYWLVPGFSQSGSPGRALFLWAFAVSALAGLGFDRLVSGEAPRVRSVVIAVAFVAAAGAALVALWLPVPDALVGKGLPWDPQLARQGALLLLAAGATIALAAVPARRAALTALALVVLIADLFATGIAYNPTSRAAEVFPPTELTTSLREMAGHDRIMPVNTGWSFRGPHAVLPPNAAMAYGLRDVQGYDSLFPKQYREFLTKLDGADPSPPEVGNMVFTRDPASPLAAMAGVHEVVGREPLPLSVPSEQLDDAHVYQLPAAPGRATAREAGGQAVPVTWLEDEPDWVRLRVDAAGPARLTLADEWYPGWHATVDGRPVAIRRAPEIFRSVDVPSGAHVVSFVYRPASFLAGLYAMLLALAVISGAAVWSLARGRRT